MLMTPGVGVGVAEGLGVGVAVGFLVGEGEVPGVGVSVGISEVEGVGVVSEAGSLGGFVPKKYAVPTTAASTSTATAIVRILLFTTMIVKYYTPRFPPLQIQYRNI